jgi:hypothetical protein
MPRLPQSALLTCHRQRFPYLRTSTRAIVTCHSSLHVDLRLAFGGAGPFGTTTTLCAHQTGCFGLHVVASVVRWNCLHVKCLPAVYFLILGCSACLVITSRRLLREQSKEAELFILSSQPTRNVIECALGIQQVIADHTWTNNEWEEKDPSFLVPLCQETQISCLCPIAHDESFK